MNSSKQISFQFKQEILAAIVVFLVALPLSLGIAVATGTSPTAGIISAAIGGIIVGFFAGCPLQVSGPAAGLITIVADIIYQHGFEKLGIIVFLAGIIQLLFAVFRIGPLFRAVAPSVIQGMLSAIGIMIFASQFHVMVGDVPSRSPFQNLISIPGSLFHGLLPMDGSSYHRSAFIGVVTILTILLWNFAPTKLRKVPAALMGVIVSIIISTFYTLDVGFLEIPDNPFSEISILNLNNYKEFFTSDILIMALTVAFVGTAETLLTAIAVDKLHTGVRTKFSKEIFAQAMGNMVAGLLGVLPVSGVIVRSATNVSAGAKTRLSTIMHGVLILFFIILFPHILEMIPTSCLAAILVYTGVKLVNYKALKKIFSYSKAEFVIYLITVIAIIQTNLLEGIIIGLVVSLLRLFQQINHIKISITRDEHNIEVDLEGAANFVTIPKLADSLDALEAGKTVHVFFDNCQYMDHSCIDYLLSWEEQYRSQGGTVELQLHTITDRFSKYRETATDERESTK
jgi:MFS superfamily sulfate permease-like transporter